MSLQREENAGTSTAPSMNLKKRRDALSEALTLFRVDWIRDHLTGAAPTTDAAILSSPLQQLHSLAFESDFGFDPRESGRTDCNAIASGESVLVPAFSRDGFSASYLLAETYGVYSEGNITSVNGLGSARFIAREDDGIYVSFIRQPHGDILMHCKRGIRYSTLYCFGFPQGTLNPDVIETNKDVAFFERLLHTVFYIESSNPCPSCGGTDPNPCSCSLQFISPKSPLDLSAITHNIIQTHLAKVSGTGLYEVFENGVSKQITRVNAQKQSVRIAKPGVTKRLLNWAIGDALGNTSIGKTLAVRSPFDLQSHTSRLDLNDFEDAFTASPLVLDDFITTPTTSEVSPPTTDMGDPLDFLDLPGTPIEPLGEPAVSSVISGTNQVTEEKPVSDSHPLLTPSVPLPEIVLPQPTNVAPARTLNPTPTASVSNRGPIPIAPRYSMEAIQTQLDMAVLDREMNKTAEELRAWKLYQRKIRNRESAARSNLARKQKLELACKKQRAATR